MVIFNADPKAIRELARQESMDKNMIVGIKSGIKSKIHDKNGAYVYPMTIRRKKKKKEKEEEMELGNLEGDEKEAMCGLCGDEDFTSF